MLKSALILFFLLLIIINFNLTLFQAFTTIFLLLFINQIRQYLNKNKAILYYNQNQQNQQILNECPSIKNQRYQPPFLFQGCLSQIISLELFGKKNKDLYFKKESVIDPEGKIDGITISWCYHKNINELKNKDILIFVLPGLTGGQDDNYINELVTHIFQQGYQPVIYNYRILSQTLSFKNSKSHIDLMSDLQLTLTYIKENYPQYKKIFGIGHSYGANQLVNYLGKFNEKPLLDAGVSISNPYCLSVSSTFLYSTIYDWIIARILTRKLNEVKDMYKDCPKQWGLNLEKGLNAKTVYEFDHNVTIRFYGYPTVHTYYRKIGCINQIFNVKVPLFCLSAEDDGISHQKAIPRDECTINKNIIMMVTDRGSHVVWLQGNNPFNLKCWFPIPAMEFLNSVAKKI